MYCASCGKEIPDDSIFCKECGARQGGAFTADGAPVGGAATRLSYTMMGLNRAAALGIGMKWFKFLIYFSLFFSALQGIFTAVTAITGAHYGGEATAVYSVFSELKAVDVAYGIISLLLSGAAILTRQNLAKFKLVGIKQFYWMYGISIAASVGYIAVASIMTGITLEALLTNQVIIDIAVPVLMFSANIAYFNNRKVLFS